MAKFVWSDSHFEEISRRLDALDAEQKRQIFAQPEDRPTCKVNSTRHGIEIYFEKRPKEEVLDELRKKGWRWQHQKQCWYTRVTTESLFLAMSLCHGNMVSETHQQKPSSAITPVSQNETTSASYNIVEDGAVISNVKITKKGNNYTVQSTNNQLICFDCKRMISIHAPACPFCGCPMSYITEQDFIETQKVVEEKRLAAERRRLEAEEAKRIERQKAREDKKRREMEEFLRKEKEAQIRADKIKDICKKYSVSKDMVNRLISSSVSPEVLEARIQRILYYKRQYPHLKINISQFITSDTIDDYVRHQKEEENPTLRCTGNCSTCTREYCVEAQ